MYNFKSDYLEGAHPSIIKKLMETNTEQTVGYGEDKYCEEASEVIKELIDNENADIHFVVGGTQANLLVISSILRPHEAVIAVSSGHINVHETGAIENVGHKILTVQGKDGKIRPCDIEYVLSLHTDCHMVKPKMVFISNSTEIGTLYTLDEIQAISKCCDENDLYLYLDGARLGSALCSEINDVELRHLARYCDVFYIGGTKNGALFGEAIVINNDELKEDFRYLIKQKGAMLAKGRLLGIQFFELFKEDLYFELAAHANAMAMKMKEGLVKLGFELFTDSYTNQLFMIIENDLVKEIEKKYEVTFFEPYDENSAVIRFVTSWNTPEYVIDEFLDDMKELVG